MEQEFADIQECARSKFNWDFIEALIKRVKELKPETQLFNLAEGIMWYDAEKSWIFHKDRVKEFEHTGNLKIGI